MITFLEENAQLYFTITSTCTAVQQFSTINFSLSRIENVEKSGNEMFRGNYGFRNKIK